VSAASDHGEEARGQLDKSMTGTCSAAGGVEAIFSGGDPRIRLRPRPCETLLNAGPVRFDYVPKGTAHASALRLSNSFGFEGRRSCFQKRFDPRAPRGCAACSSIQGPLRLRGSASGVLPLALVCLRGLAAGRGLSVSASCFGHRLACRGPAAILRAAVSLELAGGGGCFLARPRGAGMELARQRRPEPRSRRLTQASSQRKSMTAQKQTASLRRPEIDCSADSHESRRIQTLLKSAFRSSLRTEGFDRRSARMRGPRGT